MFKKLALVTAVVAMTFGAVVVPASAKTQKGNALSSYNVSKYKTVKNKNYYKSAYNYETVPTYAHDPFQTAADSINSTKGRKVNFKTDVFLPQSYKSSGDWSNPQSIVMTPNCSTAYVMYTTKSNSNNGRVIKYDLSGLKKAGYLGHYEKLRRAVYTHDKKVMKYVHVGPKFKTGHGQSLARNPKNGELWFVSKPGIHAEVQRLSTKSLKPNATVKFKLSSTVPMSPVLSFDKAGRAYFVGYATGGWAPKKSLKIYQGKISTHKVHFKLVMQGLRHGAGYHSQSLAYNARRNRLYAIADSSIVSFPVSKLGHMKASDVEGTHFNKNREFEGIQFASNGRAYLLTNKGPEIMAADRTNF